MRRKEVLRSTLLRSGQYINVVCWLNSSLCQLLLKTYQEKTSQVVGKVRALADSSIHPFIHLSIYPSFLSTILLSFPIGKGSRLFVLFLLRSLSTPSPFSILFSHLSSSFYLHFQNSFLLSLPCSLFPFSLRTSVWLLSPSAVFLFVCVCLYM